MPFYPPSLPPLTPTSPAYVLLSQTHREEPAVWLLPHAVQQARGGAAADWPRARLHPPGDATGHSRSLTHSRKALRVYINIFKIVLLQLL